MIENKDQNNTEQERGLNQLFKPASWQSRIEFIHHLVQHNNVLMVILAEDKGGKSSFLSLLQDSFAKDVEIGRIIAAENKTSTDLTLEITNLLQLEKCKDIEDMATQVNASKQYKILLIDDAHKLDETWLKETLSVLQNQANECYFHVCFAADHTIVPKLNHLMEKEYQDLIHTMDLGGLNEEETKTYVLQWAKNQKIDEQNLPNSALVQRIFKATAGDMAKINANIQSYIQNSMTIVKRPFLKPVIIAAGMLLSVSALTYAYLTQNTVSDFLKKHAGVNQVLAIYSNKPLKPDTKTYAVNKSRIANFKEEAVQTEVSKKTFIAAIDRSAFVLKIKDKEDPNYLPKLDVKKPKFTTENNEVKGSISFVASIQHDHLHPLEHIASNDSQVKTKTVNAAKQHYTIQLAASIKKEGIKEFAKQHHLLHKAKIYRIHNEKGYWFILTMGDYDNLQKAKRDIQNLPKELTKYKPWVRVSRSLNRLG